jgi:tripartite-type tricarboxylate transporter receptor subunit TctC
MNARTAWLLPAAVFSLAFAAPATADAVSDFYAGKHISLIVGSASGGGFDAYARLLARHMGKHIPGNPGFVVRNMPGAGSIVSANYVYNVAPQDGTVIGAPQRGAPFEQIFGNKGPKFDPIKFHWLGSLNNEAGVLKVWHAHPVKTLEDAFKTPVILGSSGPNDSEIYPALMNNTIGTRFQIIFGYPSSTAIDLAIERQEVFGQSHSFSSAVQRYPDWKTKFNMIVQLSLKKHPDLPNVPLIFDYLDAKHLVPGVTPDEARAFWRLMLTQKVMGRPFMLGPGVPAGRVAALRRAFSATVADRDFIADADKQKREIVPVTGGEIQQMIRDVASAPKPVIAKLKDFIRYKGTRVVAKVELPVHTGKVTKVEGGGRKVTIDAAGKAIAAGVSGSRTKVTTDGKPADRSTIKVGMTCRLTLSSPGAKEATAVDCKG